MKDYKCVVMNKTFAEHQFLVVYKNLTFEDASTIKDLSREQGFDAFIAKMKEQSYT